mmetsp:Transcript_23111/g.68679  ORF Transcript_23111/g.68679 Transcript_23111/m.68679 type:complete len:258 (-) Transcript_23111:501-1274(-)
MSSCSLPAQLTSTIGERTSQQPALTPPHAALSSHGDGNHVGHREPSSSSMHVLPMHGDFQLSAEPRYRGEQVCGTSEHGAVRQRGPLLQPHAGRREDGDDSVAVIGRATGKADVAAALGFAWHADLLQSLARRRDMGAACSGASVRIGAQRAGLSGADSGGARGGVGALADGAGAAAARGQPGCGKQERMSAGAKARWAFEAVARYLPRGRALAYAAPECEPAVNLPAVGRASAEASGRRNCGKGRMRGHDATCVLQ